MAILHEIVTKYFFRIKVDFSNIILRGWDKSQIVDRVFDIEQNGFLQD